MKAQKKAINVPGKTTEGAKLATETADKVKAEAMETVRKLAAAEATKKAEATAVGFPSSFPQGGRWFWRGLYVEGIGMRNLNVESECGKDLNVERI